MKRRSGPQPQNQPRLQTRSMSRPRARNMSKHDSVPSARWRQRSAAASGGRRIATSSRPHVQARARPALVPRARSLPIVVRDMKRALLAIAASGCLAQPTPWPGVLGSPDDVETAPGTTSAIAWSPIARVRALARSSWSGRRWHGHPAQRLARGRSRARDHRSVAARAGPRARGRRRGRGDPSSGRVGPLSFHAELRARPAATRARTVHRRRFRMGSSRSPAARR